MAPVAQLLQYGISAYGLCIVLGAGLAVLYAAASGQRRGLLWEDIAVVAFCGIGFGFLGAKLLYLFTAFSPAQLWLLVRRGTFDVVLSGGFVFYGGLCLGVLGCLLGAKLTRADPGALEDTLATALPLAHGMGRIGCFFAGCCYGIPTKSPVHVLYETAAGGAPIGIPLAPVQLMEAGLLFGLFGLLAVFGEKIPRRVFPVYLMAYAGIRLVTERYRGDAVRGMLYGVSTSTWISTAVLLAGVLLLLHRIRNWKNCIRQAKSGH